MRLQFGRDFIPVPAIPQKTVQEHQPWRVTRPMNPSMQTESDVLHDLFPYAPWPAGFFPATAVVTASRRAWWHKRFSARAVRTSMMADAPMA